MKRSEKLLIGTVAVLAAGFIGGMFWTTFKGKKNMEVICKKAKDLFRND